MPRISFNRQSPAYTFVLANVLKRNRDYHRVEQFLRQTNPHLVVLQEVDAKWMQSMRPLFPYWKEQPLSNNFGIAIGSRIPLRQARTIDFGDLKFASIITELNLEGRPVTVVGTHPVPPMDKRRWDIRNRQLAAISEFCQKNEGPLILLGDLNCTSWSPFFEKLIRQTGLHDTRSRLGIQATWPTFGWGWQRIPIDHCLVSDHFTVVSRRTGPHVGSDHLPVVAELALSH